MGRGAGRAGRVTVESDLPKVVRRLPFGEACELDDEPVAITESIPPVVSFVALATQHYLLAQFPHRPRLERQCKWAGFILKTMLERRGYRVRLRSGYVHPGGGELNRNTGHVWCRVALPDDPKA